MAMKGALFSVPSYSFCLPLKRPGVDFLQLLKSKPKRRIRSELKLAVAMFTDNTIVSDLIATGLSGGIALSLLRLWEETAKRGVFDQKLNRKIVHVTLGSAFMLCWPMFRDLEYGRMMQLSSP